MRGLDYATLGGLLLAAVGVFGGQLLEGGHAGSLLQAAAFLIVFCGTVGAVMVQTQVSVFIEGVSLGRWALMPPVVDPRELLLRVTAWSTLARREGMLALESKLPQIRDPFTRKGIQLLVDGAQGEQIRDVMQIEIVSFEEGRRRAARVWEAAGGYSPTIGILGAVLGLIHVMENLADPSKLGAGIAVAFVATIYGVGLANLVFLPVANKLKGIIAQQVMLREMLVEGLVGIAGGEHPRSIGGKLEGYLE